MVVLIFLQEENEEEEEEEEKEGNETMGNNVAHTSDRKRLLWWRVRQKTEERNVREQRLRHQSRKMTMSICVTSS